MGKDYRLGSEFLLAFGSSRAKGRFLIVQGITGPETLARNPEPGTVYPGEGYATGASGFRVSGLRGVGRRPLIPLGKPVGRPAEATLTSDPHHHLHALQSLTRTFRHPSFSEVQECGPKPIAHGGAAAREPAWYHSGCLCPASYLGLRPSLRVGLGVCGDFLGVRDVDSISDLHSPPVSGTSPPSAVTTT